MTAPTNDCRIFNQLWIIGAIVSSVAAIPATIWREHASWIMAVAVAVGVAIGFAIEFRRPQAWPYLLKLPTGFRMLRFYNRLLALFIRKRSLLHDPQLELIGVVPIESVTAKPESRVIVLRDEQDHSLTLIDFDRFMARVTSVVGHDLNKACEYSLMTAWKRLEALQQDRKSKSLNSSHI